MLQKEKCRSDPGDLPASHAYSHVEKMRLGGLSPSPETRANREHLAVALSVDLGVVRKCKKLKHTCLGISLHAEVSHLSGAVEQAQHDGGEPRKTDRATVSIELPLGLGNDC